MTRLQRNIEECSLPEEHSLPLTTTGNLASPPPLDLSAFRRLATTLGAAWSASARGLTEHAETRRQLVALTAACFPDDRAEVARELALRLGRGGPPPASLSTQTGAMRSLTRAMAIGTWRPFRPLDIPAEHARLDDLGARIAELRKRYPRRDSELLLRALNGDAECQRILRAGATGGAR